MLKILKKFLILVPCMVIGLFLFSGTKVFAGDAVLINTVDKVVIGEENKENTYYFSNSSTWEFRAQYSFIKEWDTFLKWRVVRPDGMATEWSDKDYYVDNQGKFIISDYKSLNYSQNLGLSSRVSVAPKVTYYVDIQYYSQLLWSDHQEEKDETLKIVVNANDELSTPVIDITHDKVTNRFTIDSYFDEEGYGIINEVKYFFSAEEKDVSLATFNSLMKKSANKGSLDITPGGKVNVKLDGDESATYLYVAVETGNGYMALNEYSLDDDSNDDSTPSNPSNPENENPKDTDPKKDNPEESKDLFGGDGFGEMILIILVIVLIVSCALIITQKIVDHKKRLY